MNDGYKPEVSELLTEAAKTFRERNEIYGSAYERTGGVLELVFGNGYAPRSSEEWEAVAATVMIVSKLCRLGHALAARGEGHTDSAHDCIVYAAMLERALDLANHANNPPAPYVPKRHYSQTNPERYPRHPEDMPDVHKPPKSDTGSAAEEHDVSLASDAFAGIPG